MKHTLTVKSCKRFFFLFPAIQILSTSSVKLSVIVSFHQICSGQLLRFEFIYYLLLLLGIFFLSK